MMRTFLDLPLTLHQPLHTLDLPAPPTPFLAAWPPVPRHVFSSIFPCTILTLTVWRPALPPFPVFEHSKFCSVNPAVVNK